MPHTVVAKTLPLPRYFGAAGRLEIRPVVTVEVHSFLRSVVPRPPASTLDVKANSIYRVHTGLWIDGGLHELVVRPTMPLYLRGLVVERVDRQDGELVLFVSVRGNETIKLSADVAAFELRGEFAGDVQAEEAPAVAAPKPVTVVSIPTPVRGGRPMGAAELSDAEKQARFLQEADDAPVKVIPADGKTGPVTTRLIDPETFEPTGKTAMMSADRVGLLKAGGKVEGGTAAKI